MNDDELIEKAYAIYESLPYTVITPAGNPKAVIFQLYRRLGARTVRLHRKRDGILMVDVFGKSRFLTCWESLLWRVFELPPKGMQVLP